MKSLEWVGIECRVGLEALERLPLGVVLDAPRLGAVIAPSHELLFPRVRVVARGVHIDVAAGPTHDPDVLTPVIGGISCQSWTERRTSKNAKEPGIDLTPHLGGHLPKPRNSRGSRTRASTKSSFHAPYRKSDCGSVPVSATRRHCLCGSSSPEHYDFQQRASSSSSHHDSPSAQRYRHSAAGGRASGATDPPVPMPC
jgi:hypothetical protein